MMIEVMCRIVSSPWFVFASGVLVIFKIWNKYTVGWCKSDAKLDGKTVIVTGANSGVGLEAAEDFAQRGARVVMVCRDMLKAEKVKTNIINSTHNKNIVLKHVDFASLECVRKCANEILSQESHIHVLLNNAGIVSDSFIKTEDGLDKLLQTNHYGPFLFTNILLGKIKASAPSRIINVSSETHRMVNLDLQNSGLGNTSSQTVNYGKSKLCNILMANELAEKLCSTGVTVNSVTPGVVYTDILRDVPTLLRIPWMFMNRCFFKSPKEGAQTLIYACVSQNVANITGKYFIDCKIKDVSNTARDAGLAKKLWELSEQIVELRENERYY